VVVNEPQLGVLGLNQASELAVEVARLTQLTLQGLNLQLHGEEGKGGEAG
jgi:hypothetical protein